jgi:hypothetical protein
MSLREAQRATKQSSAAIMITVALDCRVALRDPRNDEQKRSPRLKP